MEQQTKASACECLLQLWCHSMPHTVLVQFLVQVLSHIINHLTKSSMWSLTHNCSHVNPMSSTAAAEIFEHTWSLEVQSQLLRKNYWQKTARSDDSVTWLLCDMSLVWQTNRQTDRQTDRQKTDRRQTEDRQKTDRRQTEDRQKTDRRQTKDRQKTDKRQTKDRQTDKWIKLWEILHWSWGQITSWDVDVAFSVPHLFFGCRIASAPSNPTSGYCACSQWIKKQNQHHNINTKLKNPTAPLMLAIR